MFRILNIAGALTSYQSFLEKGSTLKSNEDFFLADFLGPHGCSKTFLSEYPPLLPPRLAQARGRHDSIGPAPAGPPPPSASHPRHPAAAAPRPVSPGTPRPFPGGPYTFFLAPFLPPLVRRLFFPTAIVRPAPWKGRGVSTPARLYENDAHARPTRTGPALSPRAGAARPGRTTAGRYQRHGGGRGEPRQSPWPWAPPPAASRSVRPRIADICALARDSRPERSAAPEMEMRAWGRCADGQSHSPGSLHRLCPDKRQVPPPAHSDVFKPNYLSPGWILSPFVNVTDVWYFLQWKLLNEELCISRIS